MTRERVVVVPGMLGSALRLERVPKGWRARVPRLDARVVWGKPGMFAWAATPGGWREALLSGNGYDDAGALVPDGLLKLPGNDPYTSLLQACAAAQRDVLVFDYDWRLGIHVNARKLRAAVVARWFADERSPDADQRVTVIAHSMGGLVARAMVEGSDGYRWVKRMWMAGTPHHGAVTAYTHFMNYTTSFYMRFDLDNVKWALGRLAPQTAHGLPRKLYLAYVMPRALQNDLARTSAGGLQLMPRFPFVIRDGGHEPAHESIAALRQAGAGRSVPELVHQLVSQLRDEQRLNTWLDSVDVNYITLASRDVLTAQGYDADKRKLVRTEGGDGVVALRSAHLPAGPRIRQITYSGIAHQRYWEDRRAVNAVTSDE
jgi:hypothetical protein